MPSDNMITRTNAGVLIPPDVAKEIVSGARKQSVAMQLMKRLPNMTTNKTKQPVLSMLPIADFVSGDNGMKVTTNTAWKDKEMVVGEIAAIIPVPQAVLDDADYDIWGECRPLLEESFARVFDNQVFNGGNPKAPAEWPTPIITAATTAGNIVTLGTGADVAEDFNQLFGLMEDQEYDVTGVAAQKKLKTQLRGLRNENGDPIYQGLTANTPANIYAVPTYFASKGTWDAARALAIAGDWNLVAYAIRQDMTFQIFDTGVISDDTGKVVYNLLQQDMVAMRAVMRIAWQVANPIDLDRQNIDNTYPLAILKGV